MAQIPLYKHRKPLGITFEVSDEMAEDFLKYKWVLNDNGYPRTYSYGLKLYAHHLVLPLIDERVIDHIDGNKLNCTIANLRRVSKGENTMRGNDMNPERNGVKWHDKRQRYRARLHKDGKEYNSYHRTIEEAQEWRRKKVLELYG